jgi:GH24 family phage-related lysozyme (muramidase)
MIFTTPIAGLLLLTLTPAVATSPAAPSSFSPLPAPGSKLATSLFVPRITFEEGRRARAYNDLFNNITVGVGHNMGSPGEDLELPRFESVTRASFITVKAGRLALRDPQIDNLLDSDLLLTLANLRKLAPDFDQLPYPAQEVVVDLAFNLGPGGLRQFRDFRQSLAQRNWRQAAWDLAHKNRDPDSPPSSYSQQVPNRSKRNVALLLTLASPQKS